MKIKPIKAVKLEITKEESDLFEECNKYLLSIVQQMCANNVSVIVNENGETICNLDDLTKVANLINDIAWHTTIVNVSGDKVK